MTRAQGCCRRRRTLPRSGPAAAAGASRTPFNIKSRRVDTGCVDHQVLLLTRAGCSLCEKAASALAGLAAELGFVCESTDVDAAADAGDPALRAEYGDRLPVVLLDGAEHSYWEVDVAQLRKDLS
ncbi:glutaredoxin family protein [Mycolicibacterium bacteremicum]|nr:glutaredoxin family protein [Mycolicibacterium bacteremicum]